MNVNSPLTVVYVHSAQRHHLYICIATVFAAQTLSAPNHHCLRNKIKEKRVSTLFPSFSVFRLVNVERKKKSDLNCRVEVNLNWFWHLFAFFLKVFARNQKNRNPKMDFDEAKENIQPLASGRNAERLEAALNAESHQEIHEQIIEQRQEFERAIENYNGDDPLELWYDYILWIEQSYPKSGKETALNEVISSCLSKFENEERYKQDRRMIKLFIKYVSETVLCILCVCQMPQINDI